MKKYPSKISYPLVVIILFILIGSTIPIVYQRIWIGLFINFLLLFFIIHLFSTTYYIIDGNLLTVKSGFLINKKISIDKVQSIRETRSLISAPALSFDRLEVNWGTYSGVVISPKEKVDFIEHMKRVNPRIEVKTK